VPATAALAAEDVAAYIK